MMREEKQSEFRADRRPPEVVFGRCAITGEIGKVVAVDLGDIAVDTPNTEDGVEYDKVTKKVIFTRWEPVVFNQQLTISKDGLEKMLGLMDEAPNPIPAYTPNLVYGWEFLMYDGSAVGQFYVKDGEEVERTIANIDMKDISEIRMIPRAPDLPKYTYNVHTQTLYKNNRVEPLKEFYTYDRPEDAETVVFRFNNITFASTIGNNLSRKVELVAGATLFCFGWCVGGLGSVNDKTSAKAIIAIDAYGQWRPYKLVEPNGN